MSGKFKKKKKINFNNGLKLYFNNKLKYLTNEHFLGNFVTKEKHNR